jgi:ADP-ribose pyrophosphatase
MQDTAKMILETERFRVEAVTHQSPDGRVRTRSIVRHPGAVTIIPMLDDEHVVLIANYRVSVRETLIEIPAGTLEPGKSPREMAERELHEETGYRASEWQELTSFFLSPGVLDERMHVFVAKGLTAGESEREPGEEIENLITPWSEAVAMCLDGRIHDAKTIAALLIYDRLRATT